MIVFSFGLPVAQSICYTAFKYSKFKLSSKLQVGDEDHAVAPEESVSRNSITVHVTRQEHGNEIMKLYSDI